MKTFALVAAAALLLGCGASSSYVEAKDATLGRVVVYRNGVAYFERNAHVRGDVLKLSVPADKVDDFLKSLTVVDVRTGQPPPISYPTQRPSSETGLIDMELKLAGAGPHDLKLSYVTETPAWKPSYRVVVDDDGKVRMQAWAIIDNTSGEDWKSVRLGVGSSSALSFRFDLQSVRTVQRETLGGNDLFAMAPPTGGATHGGSGKVLGEVSADGLGYEFSDDPLAAGGFGPNDATVRVRPGPVAQSGAGATASQRKSMRSLVTESDAGKRPATKPNEPAADKKAGGKDEQTGELDRLANELQKNGKPALVEGFAGAGDGDKQAASLDRANRLRDALVRRGVSAGQIVAVGRGEQQGKGPGARVVEGPTPAPDAAAFKKEQPPAPPLSTEPIGTSHFESTRPMNVPRGSSALVSLLDSAAKGGIVYLYDPESARGNASFPFRAVRIENPTDSTLESGPVTVFGKGRFVGEGLFDPIPARSVGFIPFALDRQVVVEQQGDEHDEIARILTVQRGVLSTEVQHTKRTKLTLYNRQDERAVVWLRHTVAAGFKLTKAPAERERLGASHVFRVEVDARGKAEVTIEEATPVFKTTDLRTPVGLDLVRVYLQTSATDERFKSHVAELVKLHTEVENFEQRIRTKREQIDELKARMDELHVQVVTLRAVKSGGAVMRSLEKKLSDMSDRVTQETLALASLQEQLMVARIRFQDGVSELSLDKAEAPKPESPTKS